MSLVRCGGVTYSDNISQARMWCQQTQHEQRCWLGGGEVLGDPSGKGREMVLSWAGGPDARCFHMRIP